MLGAPPGKQKGTNKVKLSDSKYPTLKNLWSLNLGPLCCDCYSGYTPSITYGQEDTTNSRAASGGNIVYTNGIIRALKSASTSRAFPKGEADTVLSTSQELSPVYPHGNSVSRN